MIHSEENLVAHSRQSWAHLEGGDEADFEDATCFACTTRVVKRGSPRSEARSESVSMPRSSPGRNPWSTAFAQPDLAHATFSDLLDQPVAAKNSALRRRTRGGGTLSLVDEITPGVRLGVQMRRVRQESAEPVVLSQQCFHRASQLRLTAA